jgi:phosphonatase-like hydrolase
MSKIRLVIFDIGGTIIEDHGEVVASFCAALAANGMAATEPEIRELKGSSKRDVIQNFVERQWGKNDAGNEDRIRKTYADFRTELENRFSNDGVKPIVGAESSFAWLKAHDIVCATTTGFYRSVTDRIIDSAGWRQTFAANVCSDDVKVGRPSPYMIFHAMEASGIDNVKQVLNVGDTPLDIQAGTRAGVLGVIGVLSGVHKEGRLSQESPSHLIPSVADIPFLIEAHYS